MYSQRKNIAPSLLIYVFLDYQMIHCNDFSSSQEKSWKNNTRYLFLISVLTELEIFNRDWNELLIH